MPGEEESEGTEVVTVSFGVLFPFDAVHSG